MIANLPTVSRTNLLHACLTLTCSTKIYILSDLRKKKTNQNFPITWDVLFLVPFFFSFFNCQASDLWQILVLWAFFLCWLQNWCCSFWCLQLKRFYPATNRSLGHSLSPPLFSDLSRFVLTLLLVWFIFFLWAYCSGFAACLNCIAVPLLFVSLGAKQLQKSALKSVIKRVIDPHCALNWQGSDQLTINVFPFVGDLLLCYPVSF